MDEDTDTSPDDGGDDSPRKRKSPMDQYDGVELGGVSFSPDGPIVSLGAPAKVPDATPANFVCLRGPCRYYWELATHLLSENPSETWNGSLVDPLTKKPVREPRQITRTCRAHPGTETDLTDDCVYACSLWDPLTPREVKALDKRRRKHLKLYPQGA